MNLGSFAWLAVFPALGFLIVVHELGHYWVGRKMGIKIEEFGIGFPPRAKVLFVRKGVPFTLNWLPIGGFVRFAGEEGGFDDPDSLASAAPRRRIPVLAAGVIANILVAMFLFGLIFAIWGRPMANSVSVSAPDEYAQSVGFQEDDRIISINGQAITNQEQVSTIVADSNGAPMTVVLERDDQQLTINAAPKYREDTQKYLFGIGLAPTLEPVNIFAAFANGVTYSLRVLGDMVIGITTLLAGLLGYGEKPSGGFVGPVGIARFTGRAAMSGWQTYLSLTAVLSLNLALFNILPLPALDGSRIVFALIEAVRRKRIPPEREAVVHAVGMMVLLGLMVIITLSDVGNIINGNPAIPMPTATPGVVAPTPGIAP